MKCPNPQCDNGIIRGTQVGCAACSGKVSVVAPSAPQQAREWILANDASDPANLRQRTADAEVCRAIMRILAAKHQPWNALVPDLSRVCEAFAASRLAAKEAEISRLTAELKGIGEALMIVWDGECWEVGFENKPDGFPTLVEACQALYKDSDAVQKAKEELEAVNASLTQQVEELTKRLGCWGQ
jgi:hypothetical protein